MKRELAAIVGYIMYYDLLEDKRGGSYFSKIDLAIDLAEQFLTAYMQEEKEGWVAVDFEETLNEFVKNI